TAIATLGTVAGQNQFSANAAGVPTVNFTERGQALSGQSLRVAVASTHTAGQSFTATVTVVDSLGNVVTSSLARITLAVGAPFVLSGNTTATAASGVATFNEIGRAHV